MVAAHRSPLRILVVDDDHDDFLIVSDHLARAGLHDVTWASDSSEGLGLIETDVFDLVLVDHQLGASTGLDVIRTSLGFRNPRPKVAL